MNTNTPTDVFLPPPAPARSPGHFFAQRDWLNRWSLVVRALSASATFLALATAIVALNLGNKYIILDPTGNVIVAPARSFEQSTELHTQQALLAASALLLRHPSDFDLPELVPVLFSGTALQEATRLRTAETPEFQLKSLHQKPAISRIEAIELRPDAVRLQVSGQVLRSGLFQDQAFTEVLPFTLEMVLKVNQDMLRNRRQPTVVTDFSLRYETTHR